MKILLLTLPILTAGAGTAATIALAGTPGGYQRSRPTPFYRGDGLGAIVSTSGTAAAEADRGKGAPPRRWGISVRL